MNQINGDTALLNAPPTSGQFIMNPVGDEAPKRAPRKNQGPRFYNVGRRPNRQPMPSEIQRPDASRLSTLAQDYAVRIDECETKRHRVEAQIDRKSQHRNAQIKRREAERQRQESLFHRRLHAAFLDGIWIQYTGQHPDADHTNRLAFFAWAESNGAYPHGTKALQQDWLNATEGRPVTQRRTTYKVPSEQIRGNTTDTRNRPNQNAQPSTKPNTKASSAPISKPASQTQQTATEQDHKAPLNTRNWIAIGIFTSAVIIAAAAVLFAG